jgi:hypothetical protein
MGVSDQAKNVIPLKFLGKIKKKFFSSCKLNPGTYCILIIYNYTKLLDVFCLGTYLKNRIPLIWPRFLQKRTKQLLGIFNVFILNRLQKFHTRHKNENTSTLKCYTSIRVAQTLTWRQSDQQKD